MIYKAKIVFNHIPQITSQMRLKASLQVHRSSFAIEAGVKQDMGGSKTGRMYPRGGGRMHQASAPGEAPAIDYGDLLNSLDTQFESDLRGIVFSSKDYSIPLELGSVKMAPRPSFGPAAEAEWPNFLAGMKGIADG